MRRLFVFRHGETDWNREGRFQGHLDIPLNDTGREQVRQLAEKLCEQNLQAILSSDLQRARETAEIIAQRLGIPVFHTAGLREAHLGEAQGLTRDEIIAKFGQKSLERWRSSLPQDADVGYAGGETGRQVMDRVFESMESFLMSQPFERVGISTHGGVIRRIMERIVANECPQAWPEASSDGRRVVPIPNGVLYVIGYDHSNRNWKWIESAVGSLSQNSSCK